MTFVENEKKLFVASVECIILELNGSTLKLQYSFGMPEQPIRRWIRIVIEILSIKIQRAWIWSDHGFFQGGI